MRPLLPGEPATGAVALRVAYDGTRFSGSQRQPDARTVDGELLRAFDAIGATPRQFRSGSRTDAGVSAVGNVVAFETDFRPAELCRAANAHLRDAWCHAYSEVPVGFAPRRAARSRSYRYFLPESDVDASRLGEALSLFVGEHDFSAFARVEAHRSPIRTVTRAAAREAPGLVVVDVEGPSFLWNQVRRMVASALAVARGEATAGDVRRALLTGEGKDLGCAPAEGLVLLDVDVGVAWTRDDAAAHAASRVLGAAERRLRTSLAVHSALRAAMAGDGRRPNLEDP